MTAPTPAGGYFPDPGDRVTAVLHTAGPRSYTGTVRGANGVTDTVELVLPDGGSVMLRPGPVHRWSYVPADDDVSARVLEADARAVLAQPDPVAAVARLIARVRISAARPPRSGVW